MVFPVRQVCAVVLAAAVLLVSATCTSAGCLLPMGPPKTQTPEAHACCHREKPAPPAQAPAKDGCPLCQGSVLMVKGVEKSGGSDLSPTFLCPAFYTVDPIASALSTVPVPSAGFADLTPPGSPPTLLALHCALLT